MDRTIVASQPRFRCGFTVRKPGSLTIGYPLCSLVLGDRGILLYGPSGGQIANLELSNSTQFVYSSQCVIRILETDLKMSIRVEGRASAGLRDLEARCSSGR